jgi:GAF domain-containing protein
MTDPGSELLRQLAQLATDVAPALVPVEHTELISSIAEAAKRVFRAQACSVAIVETDREHLLFYAASTDAGDIVGKRIPIDRGLAGWVVASGQPLAVADVSADPRFAREVAESTGYVPRSILAMPLETEHEMLGVIEVLDPAGEADDTGASLDLLAVFARQAALALSATRAFADLGQVLLSALVARAASGEELSAALLAVAAEHRESPAEIARLAATFGELARLDPDAVRAAREVVDILLAYTRRQQELR